MRYIALFLWWMLPLFCADTSTQLSYYETPRSLSIHEVIHQPFTNLESDSISRGLTDHTLWIRIGNDALQRPDRHLLYLNNPTLDKIDLYQDETLIMQTGDHRYDPRRNTLGYSFVLDTSQPHTWYLKLQSQSGLYTRLRLGTPQQHRHMVESEKLFLMFFFGFLFSITLYNAFLFISLKERVYLYYVAFQVSIFTLFLAYSGIGYYLLWPGNVSLNELLYRKGEILALLFALLFAREFLAIPKHFFYLNRWIIATLAVLVYILLTPWSLHGWLYQITLIWTVLLGFVIIIRAITARLPNATLFFVATVSVLTGTLLVFLKIFGILEVTPLTTWGVYLGSMLEALLFSMALANRIHLLKQREQELIEHQRILLEEEVKRQTISLRHMVKDKEILLKELNHRVKNNLQIISSFVSFASTQSQDKQTLQTLQQRIHAISLLYSSLYKPDSKSIVEMPTYIRHLTHEIFEIYRPDIALDLEIDKIELDFDRAITIGLLINEIITNMIRHAFEGIDTPQIRIRMHPSKDQDYILEISDNGRGFETARSHRGLGLKLIQRLTHKQLNGSFHLESSDRGSCFTILFRR